MLEIKSQHLTWVGPKKNPRDTYFLAPKFFYIV